MFDRVSPDPMAFDPRLFDPMLVNRSSGTRFVPDIKFKRKKKKFCKLGETNVFSPYF